MRISFDMETPIARPAEDVFAFVTDPRTLRLWDPRVVEAEIIGGGPLREGSRVREVRHAGFARLESVVVVADYQPPRAFSLRIEDGPFPVHADLTFEPVGEALTIVRLHAHGTPPGPQVLAPIVRAKGRRSLRSQYARLKRVLEAEDAAREAPR